MLLLLIWITAVGCARPASTIPGADADSAGKFTATDRPITAVATVGMVADLVRNVGGERVQVKQIMGAGVDPHLYKTTRGDVQTIMQGDIVFYSGLMLEGKMADALIKIARTKPVIAVTEELEEDQLFEPAEMEGHYDPHVWMDVSAWAQCVDVVAESLAGFDPKHADSYRANAVEYKQKLAELHQFALDALGSVPEESRILVTSHDAFNYFGRAYGLEVLGVQGLSTESEAGLLRINQLVDLLVERKVKAVFVESSVPRKNIESLVEGARSKGHTVLIGGELYSDAMGAEATYEGTYIGMLDHNITLVARGLGGTAPEAGFQGLLSPPQ